MTTFTIEPRGRFSLAAAQDFAGGFSAGIGAHGTATGLLMIFPVEGWRDSAAVDVWQTVDGTVHGEVAGSDDIETVRRQAARSLSLDHDGTGWVAVGERDAVLGAIQARYDWLRPVCFYSAYEAATSFVIGQRISMRQARVVKDRLSAEHGDPIEIGGEVVRPFPRPQRLLELEAVQGISAVKVGRLRDLARAALDGALDTERLRALPEDEALDRASSAARRRSMDGAGDPDARLRRGQFASARRRDQPDRGGFALRSPGTARRRDLDRDVRDVAPVPDVGHGPSPHGVAPRATSHAELPAGPLSDLTALHLVRTVPAELSGQQIQGVDVGRADSPKVALVERGDLRFAEALCERHDARVDHSEFEILIGSLQCATPSEIDTGRRLDAIDACQDIVKEDQPRGGIEPATAPVVEFGQDEGRDQQVLVGVGQQSGATEVIRVRGIKRSQQRPRVADERHGSTRFVGDGICGDIGSGSTVGRTGDADAWAPPRTQRDRLLFDGFAQKGGQRDAAPLGLRLQGPEDVRWRADGGPAKVCHVPDASITMRDAQGSRRRGSGRRGLPFRGPSQILGLTGGTSTVVL